MNQTTTLQALITKWGPLCKQHGISDVETVKFLSQVARMLRD
jgi:hypothetical protein